MSDGKDRKSQVPAVVPRAELQREQMHPLVQAVTATGQEMTPETLEKLLQVQQQWEANEARKAYVRDMAACKAEMPSIIGKDAENTHTKVKYSTLRNAVQQITRPLAAYGFSIGGDASVDGGKVNVSVSITHHLGHSESIGLEAAPDKGPQRSDVQAIGSTITYLRRYGLMTLMGIASGEEDDADANAPDLKASVRALEAFEAMGKTRDELEEYLSSDDGEPKPMHQWTREDIAKLRTWAKDLKAGKPEQDGP